MELGPGVLLFRPCTPLYKSIQFAKDSSSANLNRVHSELISRARRESNPFRGFSPDPRVKSPMLYLTAFLLELSYGPAAEFAKEALFCVESRHQPTDCGQALSHRPFIGERRLHY